MQYLIGFIIALFIALTGVGAGTITVPVLVLFLGVPAPVAVGIGLMFATAVKLILVPSQILRKNVAWKTLAFMLAGAGGAGGGDRVVVSEASCHGGIAEPDECAAGGDSGDDGGVADCTLAEADQGERAETGSPTAAGWLMLPVGAEVGFSSAGAGALGSCGAAEFDAGAAGAGGGDGYCVWVQLISAIGERGALVPGQYNLKH